MKTVKPQLNDTYHSQTMSNDKDICETVCEVVAVFNVIPYTTCDAGYIKFVKTYATRRERIETDRAFVSQ